MKTIDEKNRLIAEFMGVDTNSNGEFYLPQFGTIRPNGGFKTDFADFQLKYHASWDWLMPVVENIDHLEYESERLEKIDNAIKTRQIVAVHEAVVQFIEWYNEQHKFICGVCGDHVNQCTYNEEKDVDECNNCKD